MRKIDCIRSRERILWLHKRRRGVSQPPEPKSRAAAPCSLQGERGSSTIRPRHFNEDARHPDRFDPEVFDRMFGQRQTVYVVKHSGPPHPSW